MNFAVWLSAAFGLSVALLPTVAQAEKDFSSWGKYSQGTLVSETTAVLPGHIATIGLKIKLAPHWHTYWVNPGDSGTTLRLKFKTDPSVQINKVQFPFPQRLVTGTLISFGYSDEVLIPIEVQIAKNARVGHKLPVSVDAEWLVCEDVCIPAVTQLKIELPVGELTDIKPSPEFALFQRARMLLPEPQAEYPKYQDSGEAVKLALPPLPEEEEFVDFFPFRNSGVTNLPGKLTGLDLIFEKSNVPSAAGDRVGVLLMKVRASGQLRALQFGDSGWAFESRGGPAAAGGLWWMLLSAFVGGLILNLMPCVFPILSMKLLGILKLGKAHEREVRVQNLAYVGGVLVSFLGIALTLSLLRTAGALVGWGFQLQSPVFLALLSWLFFALSLNLLGLYEIDLFNVGIGGRFARVGGLWGSFFTGVLAVIVASPCTAPFMGAALGFGLSQPTPILIATFLCLGLGLAFPYLLFVIFPSITRHLPRPGVWMIRVRQVMAIPMIGTTTWVMWVLYQVRGMPSLLVVAAVCIVMGLAIVFSPGRRRGATLLVAIALVLATGFVYSSERSAKGHAVVDGPWQPYSDAGLSALKGQNVLIDMTADWCLSCKVNERLVLSDPEVLALLARKKVVLLKGDWTERNEEITRFLNGYNRVGVPFYVLFSPQHRDGLPLPEVLTKSGFIETINSEIP